MRQVVRSDHGALRHRIEIPSTPAPHGGTSLVEVLWRRKWTLLASVMIALLLGGAYLLVAQRVYAATAKLCVTEPIPDIMVARGTPFRSETFLQNQADTLLSNTVLSRAVDETRGRMTRTFAGVSNPVAWIQAGNALTVEPERKSDIIQITMESVDRDEAALFASKVVEAYISEQLDRHRHVGDAMADALVKEKVRLSEHRDRALNEMVKRRQEMGMLTLESNQLSPSIDRSASLMKLLSEADVAVLELRSRLKAAEESLTNPATLPAYIRALQVRNRDSADPGYAELQRQLTECNLVLASTKATQGEENRAAKALQSRIDSLKSQVSLKEQAIAESHLAMLKGELSAAEEKQRELMKALSSQTSAAAAGFREHTADYVKFDAEAKALQKRIEQIEDRLAQVQVNHVESTPRNVQVLQEARVAAKPLRPKRSLVLAVALLVGGMVGMGLALWRDWNDGRIRRADEIPTMLGTPVLATVPRVNARLTPVARGQIVRIDPRSPVSEAYRTIRTALRLGPARDAKTILCASPAQGDGKSTTASNLAIALAESGERTLLIDCDLREPVQHLIFECGAGMGLTSVMAGEAKLQAAIRPTRVPELYILPCGPVPRNPSELLQSKKFALLMGALEGTFDRIIIDSPPLTKVTDAHILAARADATLLVMRINQCIRGLGSEAMEGLERVGANVLGAVANDVPAAGKNYGYYGGSWPYSPSTRRVGRADAKALAATSSNGNGNGNGHAKGNGHANGNSHHEGNGNGLSKADLHWSPDPADAVVDEAKEQPAETV